MQRITLTVPNRTNDYQPLDELHKSVRAQLAEHFHGFTELHGEGGWFDPSAAHPGSEPVTVYAVDCGDDPLCLDRVRDIARYVKAAANQDAVYVTAQPIHAELV